MVPTSRKGCCIGPKAAGRCLRMQNVGQTGSDAPLARVGSNGDIPRFTHDQPSVS